MNSNCQETINSQKGVVSQGQVSLGFVNVKYSVYLKLSLVQVAPYLTW